jgi:hypothetical protein
MQSEPELKGLAKRIERASGTLAKVNVRRRTFGGWIVSDHELDSLSTASDVNSLHFGLLGIAFGAALSLGITIKTVAFADVYVYSAFWAAFLVASFATLYFAVTAYLSRRKAKTLVQAIKTESVTRQSEFFDSEFTT